MIPRNMRMFFREILHDVSSLSNIFLPVNFNVKTRFSPNFVYPGKSINFTQACIIHFLTNHIKRCFVMYHVLMHYWIIRFIWPPPPPSLFSLFIIINTHEKNILHWKRTFRNKHTKFMSKKEYKIWGMKIHFK